MFWLAISGLILGTTVGSLVVLVNVLALALKATVVLIVRLMGWTIYRKIEMPGGVTGNVKLYQKWRCKSVPPPHSIHEELPSGQGGNAHDNKGGVYGHSFTAQGRLEHAGHCPVLMANYNDPLLANNFDPPRGVVKRP